MTVNANAREAPGSQNGEIATMRRSGFFGILSLGLVAVVAGLVGYQAGFASHTVASGATVVVAGGSPGLGFLSFFLLFLGFVLCAFADRRRGPWGPVRGHGPWAGRMGPGGPGGFGPSVDHSDPRRQWIADLHRSLHEDEQTENAGRPSSTSA
jgi:hypothetical protein